MSGFAGVVVATADVLVLDAGVRFGHVLPNCRVSALPLRSKVAGDPPVLVEHFDGGGGNASIQLPLGELVRDAVMVLVEAHVVIDVRPDLVPLGELVALRWQRREGWPVELLEEALAVLLTLRFVKS